MTRPVLPALICTLCCTALTAALAPSVLVVGGTGRIGTAVAIHLLQRRPELRVVLAGRSAERGAAATAEVAAEAADCSFLELDYRDATEMRKACDGVDAVVHVAGPFVGKNKLEPLKAAIASETPVYVDVSDPLEYIDEAKQLDARKTSALLCAGAFPGFSNVLAVEAAHLLGEPVKDLNFSYFTAGLGGSGAVNLDITNYGFGRRVLRRNQLPRATRHRRDVGPVIASARWRGTHWLISAQRRSPGSWTANRRAPRRRRGAENELELAAAGPMASS